MGKKYWLVMVMLIVGMGGVIYPQAAAQGREISSMAWNREADYLAVGYSDGELHIRQSTDYDVFHQFKAHQSSVLTVAWRPDSRHLLSGGADLMVQVWETDTYTSVHDWQYPAAPQVVDWSLDGREIVVYTVDGTKYRYDAADYTLIERITFTPFTYLLPSPDKTQLLIDDGAGYVAILEAASGVELQRLPATEARWTIFAWNHDASRVAGGTYDGAILVWDTGNGDIVHTLRANEDENIGRETSAVAFLYFSEDDTRLSSISGNGNLRTFDHQTGRFLRDIEVRDTVYSAVVGAGGLLAYAWIDQPMYGILMPEIALRDGDGKGTIDDLAWSPDSNQLVVSYGAGSIFHYFMSVLEIMDVATGQVIFKEFAYSQMVDWSLDGRYIAVGSKTSFSSGFVNVVEAATGKVLYHCNFEMHAIYDVKWSPDGEHLAIIGVDGIGSSASQTVFIWEPTTDGLSSYYGGSYRLAWSPDGNYLVLPSRSDEFRTRIVDSRTGELVFEIGRASANHAAWSPDGRMIALAEDDSMGLWDGQTGAEIGVISHDQDIYVRNVAWSPDGRMLAGTSSEAVLVWDVASRALISSYPYRLNYGDALAWSPNGRWIAYGEDEILRIVDAPLGGSE